MVWDSVDSWVVFHLMSSPVLFKMLFRDRVHFRRRLYFPFTLSRNWVEHLNVTTRRGFNRTGCVSLSEMGRDKKIIEGAGFFVFHNISVK